MTRWRDQGGRVTMEGTRPTRELRNRGDQHIITKKIEKKIVAAVNPPTKQRRNPPRLLIELYQSNLTPVTVNN